MTLVKMVTKIAVGDTVVLEFKVSPLRDLSLASPAVIFNSGTTKAVSVTKDDNATAPYYRYTVKTSDFTLLDLINYNVTVTNVVGNTGIKQKQSTVSLQ